MGKVLPFPKGADRQTSRSIQDFVRAVDEPKQRALDNLAKKLEVYRFEKARDRERLGRNWHLILRDLKKQGRLKNKGKVYEILQRKSSEGAARLSYYYEIPERLLGPKLEVRIGKIIKHGDRWLRLTKQAAEIAETDLYALLVKLVDGTKIAPVSSEPTTDTPEPVRALLDLANATCRRVAVDVDIVGYFQNWSRGWVAYRYVDDKFRAGGQFSQQGDELGHPASLSPRFFSVADEDGEFELWDSTRPLPSAEFAEVGILGSLEGEAIGFEKQADGENMPKKLFDITVDYVREFRLAIGLDGGRDQVTPLLEIRGTVQLNDANTNKAIPFYPMEVLDPFKWVDEKWEVDDDFEDMDPTEQYAVWPFAGWLLRPEGPVWVRVDCKVSRDRVRQAQESLADRFDWLPRSPLGYLENYYCVLTPGNVERYLKHYCQPTDKGMLDRLTQAHIEDGLLIAGMATFSPTFTGMGLLEQALLESTKEDSLYSRMREAARGKVAKFEPEYRKALKMVNERHHKALDYLDPPREHAEEPEKHT